ncbi:MAG: hypothetical protein KAJ07_11120 [Planctomycetes bacterium]|nr:hypothetical protein [Planctomycetota bacterium]
MNEMVSSERWNTINSAEMALGVQRVIDSIQRHEEPPTECSRFLDKAIEFLVEAQAGGALITGTTLEGVSSFKGTFSPLCMATDVYISFRSESETSDDYKKVNDLLNGYRKTLTGIKEGGIRYETEPEQLNHMEGFFGVLFDLLSQQADPLMKDYSKPFTFDRG